MKTKKQLKNELNLICEKYKIEIDWEKYDVKVKTVKAGMSIGDISLIRKHGILSLAYMGKGMNINVKEYSNEYCKAIMELVNYSDEFKTFVLNYKNGVRNNSDWNMIYNITLKIENSIKELLHKIKGIEKAQGAINSLQEQIDEMQKSIDFHKTLNELNI